MGTGHLDTLVGKVTSLLKLNRYINSLCIDKILLIIMVLWNGIMDQFLLMVVVFLTNKYYLINAVP